MVCLHQSGPNYGSAYYTLLRYFSLKVMIVKSHYAGALNSPLNKSHAQSAIYWLFGKKVSNFVAYGTYF